MCVKNLFSNPNTRLGLVYSSELLPKQLLLSRRHMPTQYLPRCRMQSSHLMRLYQRSTSSFLSLIDSATGPRQVARTCVRPRECRCRLYTTLSPCPLGRCAFRTYPLWRSISSEKEKVFATVRQRRIKVSGAARFLPVWP